MLLNHPIWRIVTIDTQPSWSCPSVFAGLFLLRVILMQSRQMYGHTIAMAFIATVMVLAPTFSYPQQSEELKARTRVIYEKTADVPDGVFLSNFLGLLGVRFRGDPGRFARYLQDELYINDFEEAQEVAAFLMDVAASIDSEAIAYKRSVLCPSNTPRPSGQEVYAALDSVDDARDEISNKYLKTMEKEFGENRYSKFLAWMNSRKASTTIIRFDHAKYHEGEDPDIVRQNLCKRLDSLSAEQGR